MIGFGKFNEDIVLHCSGRKAPIPARAHFITTMRARCAWRNCAQTRRSPLFFVNPTQFARTKDSDCYPRTWKSDLANSRWSAGRDLASRGEGDV